MIIIMVVVVVHQNTYMMEVLHTDTMEVRVVAEAGTSTMIRMGKPTRVVVVVVEKT